MLEENSFYNEAQPSKVRWELKGLKILQIDQKFKVFLKNFQ